MIEFYTFEDEVWYRSDRDNQRLTEQSRDIIRDMFERIELSYPKAFKCLSEEYLKCKQNTPYYQFRIVNRFCKCNFGAIDNTTDIDVVGRFNFERISCPLRGECKLENVVCSPEFDSKISNSEMRVLELVYKKYSTSEIADKLFLSEYTVKNHIRNVYSRLGFHEKAEFIDYAHRNNLFKNELSI